MTTQRFLDPTNDVAFKKVFVDKQERLISFLNSLLKERMGGKIISIAFLPTEEIPNLGQGKRNMFDLKVKDEHGRIYVVEMQRKPDKHFVLRVQLYASHALVSNVTKGSTGRDIIPVIVISICDHKIFGDEVPCVSFHRTTEEETNECHLFLLKYLFIELPKFIKTEEELKTIEDDWIYFFKHSSELKEVPKNIRDENVIEAYKEIEQFNWSTEEYDAYVRASMTLDSELTKIETAFEEGKAEGREEEKIQIIKNLLSSGLDIKTMSESTGLSESEVEKLKK